MRTHGLPQLIKYIDVRGVNKSMIEFKANLDKLNDFFSIFPKWGISVTIKLLKELRNDSEAMCNKYFSIISERILNELSARPDGLDVESYKKEASQLKVHFNRIKLCMRNTDFRFFIHEGLNEDMFYVSNNKVYGNLNTMYFYVNENSRYAECGDESFILAYNLALLYEKEHNHTKWLENMILSGIADVYAVNRDIGSLYALASYLYEQGQLDRAYRYSTYCSDIGITFKSRVRLLHQQKLQRRIHQSYIERDHMQQKQLKLFLLFISFLTIVLLIALFFLRRQTRRRRKALVELHVANGRLKSLNSELQKLNLVLRDTNYIKEEYIGQVFKLCSSYICRMEEYRKKLNRKLKAGQLEDLKKMISSTSTMSDEMKDFYEKFDSIILHLYPDFVEHFNSLLRPEEHIEVKSGRLNTELRIHALIRMGVTDSEKIAEFLHCSLQTVYNNRSITLNKSSLSKEEFLRAVKEVCKK